MKAESVEVHKVNEVAFERRQNLKLYPKDSRGYFNLLSPYQLYKLIAWITPQLIRVEQMDLCADLIASHIEMNRATRLATMKQKLLQNQDMDFEDFVSPYTNKSRQGSIDSVNHKPSS